MGKDSRSFSNLLYENFGAFQILRLLLEIRIQDGFASFQHDVFINGASLIDQIEPLLDEPLVGKITGMFRPTKHNDTLDSLNLDIDRVNIQSMKDKDGVLEKNIR